MTALSPAERAAALAVLGLPADATGAQVTRAYRRLARAAHPDATGRTDAAAGDRFTAISDAYHRLAAAQTTPVGDHPTTRPAPPATPPATPPTARPAAPPTTPPGPDPGGYPGRRPPIVAGPVIITPTPKPAPGAWGGTR